LILQHTAMECNDKMTAHDLTLWRVRLGLTQAEAAERLGRHWTMISRYETGRIEIPRSIELLCEAIEAAPRHA
jgi:transcriptional regulator with XRE-family HTH domain